MRHWVQSKGVRSRHSLRRFYPLTPILLVLPCHVRKMLKVPDPQLEAQFEATPNSMKDVRVIKPTGRLDVTTAAKFRLEVSDLVASKPAYLLIDLGGVTFMDSSGLGALVSALKTVRTVDGKMAICSLTEQVQMLFELTSMNKIFKIYSDAAEFHASLNLEADR